MQKPQKKAAYWLVLSALSYLTKPHSPRDDANYRGLDPASNIEEDDSSQTWPQVNLI